MPVREGERGREALVKILSFRLIRMDYKVEEEIARCTSTAGYEKSTEAALLVRRPIFANWYPRHRRDYGIHPSPIVFPSVQSGVRKRELIIHREREGGREAGMPFGGNGEAKLRASARWGLSKEAAIAAVESRWNRRLKGIGNRSSHSSRLGASSSGAHTSARTPANLTRASGKWVILRP